MFRNTYTGAALLEPTPRRRSSAQVLQRAARGRIPRRRKPRSHADPCANARARRHLRGRAAVARREPTLHAGRQRAARMLHMVVSLSLFLSLYIYIYIYIYIYMYVFICVGVGVCCAS